MNIRRISFAAFILFGLFAAGLLFISCAGNQPTSNTQPTQTTSAPPASVTYPPGIILADLFAVNCAVCHRADRRGISGLGPALTSESLAGIDHSSIVSTIEDGKSSGRMPSFKANLTSEEIDALAWYLVTEK